MGITAPVVSIGLAKDGSIAVPKGSFDVGLYTGSGSLGSNGTSILVGHRSWKRGEPAVFDNLDSIKIGDTVLVHSAASVKNVYVVTSVEVFDQEEDATEALSKESVPTIKLVSCVGSWDLKAKTSTQRIVVTAKRFLK